MSLASAPESLQETPRSDPWEQLDRIERTIREQFAHRIYNFRIRAFDDGLVLEGRTKTYYGKQSVLQAVMNATELPILADRIDVG